MKKVTIIAAAIMMLHGTLIAQKSVAEKDVKVNFVKDFQRQVKDATEVAWWQMDEQTFKVTYLDGEKSRQAMVFSNKGSETHYFIEDKFYPQSIKDTVAKNYAKYEITEVWVRKVRNKMTYQARVAKRSGFLWWKKESDVKVLNFEVDGKFVNEEQ